MILRFKFLKKKEKAIVSKCEQSYWHFASHLQILTPLIQEWIDNIKINERCIPDSHQNKQIKQDD